MRGFDRDLSAVIAAHFLIAWSSASAGNSASTARTMKNTTPATSAMWGRTCVSHLRQGNNDCDCRMLAYGLLPKNAAGKRLGSRMSLYMKKARLIAGPGLPRYNALVQLPSQNGA